MTAKVETLTYAEFAEIDERVRLILWSDGPQIRKIKIRLEESEKKRLVLLTMLTSVEKARQCKLIGKVSAECTTKMLLPGQFLSVEKVIEATSSCHAVSHDFAKVAAEYAAKKKDDGWIMRVLMVRTGLHYYTACELLNLLDPDPRVAVKAKLEAKVGRSKTRLISPEQASRELPDIPGEFYCGSGGCNNIEQIGGKNFKLCSQCKLIRYCSKECQRAHWSAHKSDCVKSVRVVASKK